MTYETLRVERHGHIGWLEFNRPEAGNAMNALMLTELERAWNELAGDPDVRVIVNTGRGRAFQTGLDVQQLARDRDALREQSRRTRDATLRLTAWHNGVWKPVIAAINGTCAGGGLHFVADADIVIAARGAQFLDPHVSIGQVTAFETIALSKKSPMESVVRMALMGAHERVDADRALELGILSAVVEPAELRGAAEQLASKIAANSPTAMAFSKRALWRSFELGRSDAYREAMEARRSMAGHPDQSEGRTADLERRNPKWAPMSI